MSNTPFYVIKKIIMSRIINKDDYNVFSTNVEKYFNLRDNVICFYNGLNWNAILLEDMLAYPILYFEFWHEKSQTTYINSLVVCPITMRMMLYKGIIEIIDIVKDRLYLKNLDTDDEFFMDLPYTGHYDEKGNVKKIKSQTKRHEVRLLTLRDLFLVISDPKYIVLKNKEKKIIKDDYYTNRYTYDNLPIYTMFHPKTIVYMIQYYSKANNKYKYIVLIGKNISKTEVTGYNTKASGIFDYIKSNYDKLTNKRAYIYPIFWFMVDKIYNDVNVLVV